MECGLNQENRGYQHPTREIDGWMTWHELNWLFDTAREMRNVLEVGSWMGRSTYALLTGCPGTVYAVDHFKGSKSELKNYHKLALTEDIHAIFQQNVGHFKNLVTLKMESLEAAQLFGDKWLDMVFIDGSHDQEDVEADIKAWMPKCRRILCGHDLYDLGVMKAIGKLDLSVQNNTGSIWSVRL